MKKITSFDLSIFLLYIFQAYLYILFLNKSVALTWYNFFLYIVIAIFLGIGIILLFCFLFNLSNKSIFYNIKNKFIVFILIIIAFIFALFSLKTITGYINYVYLNNMNSLFIMGTLVFTIFFLIRKDYNAFFRCSTLIFYFYILLEIITLILLVFYCHYHNILPITFNFSNIMDYSYLYLCFLIIPIMFLLMIPKAIIKKTQSFNKKIFITYLFIAFIILLKSMMSISILGYKAITIYNYPDVVMYKNINLFGFLERIEWLVCFNNITNMFFLISLSLFYVKEGLGYILPIEKKRSYTYPLCICIILLIGSIFININYMTIVYLFILFFLIHLVLALYKLLK